jgi:hypothetical protein
MLKLKLSPLVFLAMLAYGVFAAPPGFQERQDALKARTEALKLKTEKLKEACWAAAPEGVVKSGNLIIVDDVCTVDGVSWKIDVDIEWDDDVDYESDYELIG